MMQADVTSYIAKQSGTAVVGPARLKGITVTSATVSARNTAIADPTVSKSGTWSRTGTTVTVTINDNGLTNGQRVFLDVAAGTTMRDGVYAVSNVTTNTFTVTSATSGTASGTVTMYTAIYVELDTFNTVGLPIKIPGEGIYCPNGIYVGLGSSVTATVFYSGGERSASATYFITTESSDPLITESGNNLITE